VAGPTRETTPWSPLVNYRRAGRVRAADAGAGGRRASVKRGQKYGAPAKLLSKAKHREVIAHPGVLVDAMPDTSQMILGLHAIEW
jgi:hypothetical protein